MRSWKTAKTTAEAVYLYFRAHPEIWFAPDHVASQTGVGIRQTRILVLALQELGKLQHIEAVTAPAWGRPARLYCATRTTEDSLSQIEIFHEALEKGGLVELLHRNRRRAS